MSDPIQGYLDNMKKELIDAGELGPDEKLNASELQNRYMKFMIKKAQGEMTGLKPKAPPAQKVEPPKAPAAVAPPKRDTPEAKMQKQFRSSLDNLLASRDRSNEIMKQNQTLVLELLSSQDPILAVEFLKLQTWLTKSVEEGLDQKELTKETSKKVEAVSKLFKTKITRPEDLKKRMDLLLPKLQKNNTALEKNQSELTASAKEMASMFEQSGGEAK